MNFLLIAFLIGGGYLALRSSQTGVPITQEISDVLGTGAGGVSLGSVSFAKLGPNSDSRYWFNGIKPGTVTIGGSPAGQGWNPGSVAKTSLNLAGAGIGVVEGVASTVAGVEGTTSVLAVSTTLGAATLGIGLAIGVASTIVGMINAHHQAALAAEGKALNDSEPRMENAMVLVLQAVLVGEIASAAVAQQYLLQIVKDWYAEVKGIQRGTWPYHMNIAGPSGPPSAQTDVSMTYDNSYLSKEKAPDQPFHAWKPDPCNAACVIGHYFTERNAQLTLNAVNDALAGNHGQLVFPEIPAYQTQTGYPEIMVTY